VTQPHRHRFVRGTRHAPDSSGPYRACSVCRVVQRKISGRWTTGAQAANPNEQRMIARRLLDADRPVCFTSSSSKRPTREEHMAESSTTRITKLTALNVQALREVFPADVESGRLALTATTAEWATDDAVKLLRQLGASMDALPTRGHPRASLHAVERKLSKLAFPPADQQEIPVIDQEVTTDDQTDDEPVQYEPVSIDLADVEVGPFDPACEYLLREWSYENLFEPVSSEPGTFGPFRCKGCGMTVQANHRKAHHDKHKETIKMASKTNSTPKTSKPKKPVAKDLGVPAVYLGPTGTFKPGADAALKSDLILAILGQPARKNAPHSFTKAKATALFEKFPQWQGFLTRKQEILDAKAAKAQEKLAAKAQAEREKTEAKRAGAESKATTAEADGDQTLAEAAEADGDPVEVKPDPKPASSRSRGRSRK
jgi:hypothetical protein